MKSENILVLLFVLLTSVSHAQQNRVFVPPDRTLKTFTLKEYAIKDTSFYHELCSIVFSDNTFGSITSYKHVFAMRYDTTTKQIDYLTGETFSAPFNIFDLIDEADILRTTDAGKKAIGYFYIKDMICFILKPTQTNFISQYLILTNKNKQFKIYDSIPAVGGSTDVYMNILSNRKIEVIRILRSE